MASDYSKAIADAIAMFFTDDDWKFEEVNEHGIIKTGVKLDSKLKGANIYINVLKNGFIVTSVPRIGAGTDEESLAKVAEFITRVNYGLYYGNFELDYSDGEIRYKTSMFCGSEIPSAEHIKAMIYLNISTLDDYGDGLCKVIFDICTPEEAEKECTEKYN